MKCYACRDVDDWSYTNEQDSVDVLLGEDKWHHFRNIHEFVVLLMYLIMTYMLFKLVKLSFSDSFVIYVVSLTENCYNRAKFVTLCRKVK